MSANYHQIGRSPSLDRLFLRNHDPQPFVQRLKLKDDITTVHNTVSGIKSIFSITCHMTQAESEDKNLGVLTQTGLGYEVPGYSKDMLLFCFTWRKGFCHFCVFTFWQSTQSNSKLRCLFARKLTNGFIVYVASRAVT